MNSNTSCLFDLWQANSAPIYHMSAFWPVFDEAHVMDFVRGHGGDEPEPVRPLSTASAAAAKEKIETFLSHISGLSDTDYPCLSEYIAFEQERLAAFDMIIEAHDPDAVSRHNDVLFGALGSMGSQAALGHLYAHVTKLKPRCAAAEHSQGLVLRALAAAPHHGTVEAEFEAIDGYRRRLRPLVERRFGFVQQLLDAHGGNTLSSEAVGSILETSLTHILGPDKAGWTTAVTKGAPNVFINYHRREITIPAGRVYTKSHVDTLVVHEIGVHLQRSVNGELSRERLAGLGLAGYGPAEEAFGVLLGNATKETYHQINSLIPFAVIEYASRPERPTFRQVHEFAKALIICLANPTAETLQQKRLDYARSAFSRTIRVLRLGTNELIERSTTKYWRGQLLLLQYFNEAGLTQTSFDEFFLGKYDCLDPAQLHLIKNHKLS